MKITRMAMENDFLCIADKCPKSCCEGWQIAIDDESLVKYVNCNGHIAARLHDSIDMDEHAFKQDENGRCVFLNSCGLCDLITECSDEILCDTCRLFPRHVEEYDGVREWSLSLACPHVAQMVVDNRTILALITCENDEPDPLKDDYDEFDYLLFSSLNEAREAIFDIIGNGMLSCSKKAEVIESFAAKLQLLLDRGDYDGMSNVIADYSAWLNNMLEQSNEEDDYMNADGDFAMYNSLERLSMEWDDILQKYPSFAGEIEYKSVIADCSDDEYNLIISNLFLVFIYTYFLGAVYNNMVFAYTLFCTRNVRMINALAQGISESSKRKLSRSEFVELIYSFSREIEHSDENINSLLSYFDEKLDLND